MQLDSWFKFSRRALNEIAHKLPEVDERRREWVSAEDAASMVQEPELMEIILAQ